MKPLSIYRRFLSKKSIEIQEDYSNSVFPKLMAGWAFLTFLISFNHYFSSGYLTTNSYLPCFPHFQSCKIFLGQIGLAAVPFGYTEAAVYALLFGLLVLGCYYLYAQKYVRVHLIIIALLLFKILIALTNYGIGNFDYYDIAILLVFIAYPGRHDLVKLMFVILYFLASTIKIHSGWIAGTYFSSLYYGLPFVPETLIPLATNIVIVMQMIGCWLLLSNNRKLSNFVLWFFIFFHLYSTVLVGYRYPITSLLSLLIIFIINTNKEHLQNYSLTLKHFFFFCIVLLFSVGQLIPYLIPGDHKITLEGNSYGLYMFEANHQCISRVTNSITKKEDIQFSYDARNRCDPYAYLYRLQNKYCEGKDSLLSWTFDHSINGESFIRIVNSQNLCSLQYKPFVHNEWILYGTSTQVIGKPYRNVYLTDEGIDSTALAKGDHLYPPTLARSYPVTRTFLQELLIKNNSYFITGYWILWFVTLFSVLYLWLRKKTD